MPTINNWRFHPGHGEEPPTPNDGSSHRTRTPWFVLMIVVSTVVLALVAAYWGKP